MLKLREIKNSNSQIYFQSSTDFFYPLILTIVYLLYSRFDEDYVTNC